METIRQFKLLKIISFIILISQFSSSCDGIYTETVQLPAGGWHQVVARDVPPTVGFLLFQVHNQRYNVTMAYENYSQLLPPPTLSTTASSSNNNTTQFSLVDRRQELLLPYGQYVTGTDVGLVKLVNTGNTSTGPVTGNPQSEVSMWIANPNDFTIQAIVIVTAHTKHEPIPGGCNMEFPVEISPFLRLAATNTKITIEFQHARVPDTPLTAYSLGLRMAPGCDGSFYIINYDLYAYYLAENDYTEAEYRRALQLMSNATQIIQHATKVKPYAIGPRTRTFFMAYPGRGVVYNVLATVGKDLREPYVPVATYGCDFFSTVDGCGRLHSIVGKVFVTILGIWGLVVSLRGHQWFQTQMAFFGFLGASIPTFILVTKFTDLYPDERDVIMFAAGILGAVVWVGVWRVANLPSLSVLLSGLILGFLTVAGIMFTRLGNDEIFRNDINYWLLMACGILVVPIILIPFGIIISIFSSAIVGSYTAVLAVDRFIGGSVSYIVLNVFKRAIYEDIYMANNQVPFQAKDEILLVAWAVLAFLGALLQVYASFGQAPYPAPPRSLCCSSTGRGRAFRRSISASSYGTTNTRRSFLPFATATSATGLGGNSPDRRPSDLDNASDEYSWRISEIRRKSDKKLSKNGKASKQSVSSSRFSRQVTPDSDLPVEIADEHSPLIGGITSVPPPPLSDPYRPGTSSGASGSGTGSGPGSRTDSRLSPHRPTPSSPPPPYVPDTLIYPDYNGYGSIGK